MVVETNWATAIIQRVNAQLLKSLEAQEERLGSISKKALLLHASISSLTLRGGKRLRPIVLTAGYHATSGQDANTTAIQIGTAIELLQSYLLIHDDWMDQDDERRGGPSVHSELTQQIGDKHTGECLGVLAGDLANTYAWRIFSEALESEKNSTRSQATQAFLQLQEEVIAGQQLDVIGASELGQVHDLKTGSYTVRGPLELGAILGSADSKTREWLRKLANPLGKAFQLRDELLGTFGDKKKTGKPVGQDLRKGKRTSILDLARKHLSPKNWIFLENRIGSDDMTREELEISVAMLREAKIETIVEDRIDAMRQQALQLLDNPSPGVQDTTRLRALVGWLTAREN